jgi:tetratricopeptide (TPR) repeat protein
MGFSPAQARAALAKTSTGIDVQAALDGLLAQPFQSPPSPDSGPEDLGEVDDEYIERQRIRREEEERERRRKRRQGPSRDTIAPRSREEQVQQRNGNGTPIQADQILAQASEIGQSVFTKATSLWNTGKERALKAYEEQKRVYEAQLAEKGQGHSQGQARVKDGRPRWMVEAEVGREEDREGPSASGGGFRDDDGEEIEQKPVRRARPRADEVEDRNGGRHRAPAAVSRTERPRDDLLFGEDIGSGPSRPRRPVEPARAPRVATPAAPLPARTLVSADPSAVQSSLTHKAKGNDHFKLGRFTEAESSYSTAITYLPGGHLHLVPLYNNRAATRLKLGDSKGSSEDCSSVIEIIGPAYHPSKEAPLPGDLGDEVKLADAYVKAYTKRAQAWEMGEKWKNAVEDWERVLGFDAALIGSGPVAGKTRNLAAEGLRRSKQMLDGGSSSRPSAPSTAPGSRTATKLKPKARPPVASKPAQVDRSEAVSSLRAAAKVSEAEDQQRLALKDSVEGRLNTWKGGKETNLRALLASLDTVLWDEILAGGLKVGMHELITEKQVKIKYMKVIARLHPDKVSLASDVADKDAMLIVKAGCEQDNR